MHKRNTGRGLQLGAGLLALLFLAIFPLLGLNPYFTQLMDMLGITLLILLGLNLVFGFAGQISVSQAGFFGLGAYTASLLQVKMGVSFPLAILAGTLCPALLAAILGTPILKLKGYYLALATIGLGTMLYEAMQQWQDMTGGPLGVFGIQRPPLLDNDVLYYYLIWALAVMGFLLARNLVSCAFGRAWVAIRENDMAAAAMGINAAHYKLVAFILSAAMAGLAGGLYAFLNRYISPDTFALTYSMVLIASLTIGGAGTLGGALIGTGLAILLPEVAQAFADYHVLVFGLILVAVLRFMPRGVWGTARRYLADRRDGKAAAQRQSPERRPMPEATP
jgi:ABC-type branched-subunit amino acid transport system permease subunit